jgi:AhpD family alkylhydroperoxidase
VDALAAVEWETCVLEPVRDRASERFVRKAVGMVPPGARYFFPSPWATRSLVALGFGTIPLRHVSGDLSEMIALVVSQDNSCRYCYAATRSILRILGFSEARIRRLEQDYLTADLPPRDVAALEFARCVSRATPLATCADWAPLLELGLSPAGVKEIAFIAACNVFFNRTSTLPALPFDEGDFAGRWYVRLLRPLVARMMRARYTREPAPLTAAQRKGPFAEIVNALDGLPGAARLRAVIDDAWDSPVLARRTKGLMFAVIARGIGSRVCEDEARRLLAAEGESPAAIEQALAHLSGPGVAPIDAAAAALARESIWVRPAHIQRHVRSMRSLLTHEQILDLIVVAALANMVCRLAVVIDIEPRPH